VKMQGCGKLLLIAVLSILFVHSSGDDVGFWWWTWGTGSAPGGTNIGIAFSGEVDPSKAVSESNAVKNRLPGTKYISLGGGNAAGSWTSGGLSSIDNAINGGQFSGYGGIVYDIEQGNSGLSSAFQNSFRTAKSKGFKVLVTVSHSAPYGFGDAKTLMEGFFSDGNIDYLSPQLYTSGNEGQNDYTTAQGVGWGDYKKSRARIIPSIVRGSLYSSARSYFSGQGVNITGYIQWAN